MDQINLVKYEKNFFHRTLDKIKAIFNRKKVVLLDEKKAEKERHILVEQKENFVETYDIAELIRRYELRQVTEKEMTEKEKKQLVTYYKYKNEELDREILRERAIWKSKVKQLEKTYERLKTQNSN